MQSIHDQLDSFREKGRRFKKWKNIVTALACVVVFCTVYALILPAITLEGDTYCGLEEHTHSEECYTKMVKSIEKKLVCTQEEVEPHTHTAECYASATATTSDDSEVNAAAAEAATTSETTEDELICGKIETEGHTHDDSCYEEVEVYGESELTCTQEEHEHSKACYSNPDADVETEADWMKTFEDVTFTNDWVADTIAIAKTQIGYTESTENYEVTENGDTKGYTRYGEWYGNKYGDWCAMFVSFCLNYAEVEDFPLDASCQNWIEALQQVEEDSKDAEGVVQYNAYQEASEDYIPSKGNLIFFNWDDEADSDHVGLIVNVETDENNTTTITTIEGNASDVVKYKTYELDNKTIMGYGILPEQEFYCEMEGHAHGDDCYNDTNELICTIEEHIHTDECSEQSELTKEEQAEVDAVIAAIDALPTADEFEEKLEEYEAVEDMEGYEKYWTKIKNQCKEIYTDYMILSELQKSYVTNIDKLMDFEWLWSSEILIDEITSDSPTTVAAASTSEFVDMNLYDYGSNLNTLYNSNNKYPGFQWNGGAYLKSTYDRHVIDYIDFGNSMITDLKYGSSGSGTSLGYSTNRKIVGNKGGAINALDVSSYGVTNRPIGMSLNSSIIDTSSDVLQRTLGSDGYPALTDGTSLSYLFTNNTYATKKNSTSIDGLFQQNEKSGEYYYNSRWNHAQYSGNKFTLYNQIITPNFITYPFGNFLPLNDITNGSNATQVSKITRVGGGNSSNPGYVQQIINDLIYASDYSSNATKIQLLEMLVKYRDDLKSISVSDTTAWEAWSASDAIEDYFTTNDDDADNPSADTSQIDSTLLNKMYNIDWDVDTNFFFGMDMTMNLIQPKGGMTGNDTNKDGEPDYPMEFYFTGDDDVWVYIDGVLFLDLSGIHRHVGGKIDFVNGKVHYYYLDTANTGDVSTTPYKTYTFKEILSAAGKSTDGLNSNGTFSDYTTHQFKFYYMERGSGSSVCRLNFNFPLLRQNSISVSKEVTTDTEILGNPDYKFQVLKADSSGNKTSELFIAANTTYTIYDANDNKVGTGKTDANGVFTLKAGQRAEFTGIKENAGKYYVRELLEGTVLEQYGNVTVSGESTTTSANVTVGSDTFTGMDSPVKDMSDGATSFRFTNDVDEDKLGELNISKKITEYSKTRAVKTFDIQVKLDGELLPVGTKYTVGTETRTVTTAGIITIAADETATISNILAGTEFTVQETSGSAEGYTVTYNDSGGYTITVNDGIVNGVIKTSANVQLVVTNSEKGATVTIPGTKTILNPDGEEHTYTFNLEEVTDSTGSTPKADGISGYTATATLEETGTFSFTINYVAVNLETFPQTFYYKITEQDADDSLANTTTYVVAVEVTKSGEDISAAITGMWKDGTAITDSTKYSADFINTLSGDLILSKVVVGDDNIFTKNKEFTFEIKLSPASSGEEAYKAILTNSEGEVEETSIKFTDGIATVKLKANESLRILDIVYGTTWTITESDADGYKVTYEVTANGETGSGNGAESSGAILVGTTKVEYTNTQQYKLPETGGIGTTPFIIGGMTLTLGALLYNKKRRKEEEASS